MRILSVHKKLSILGVCPYGEVWLHYHYSTGHSLYACERKREQREQKKAEVGGEVCKRNEQEE